MNSKINLQFHNSIKISFCHFNINLVNTYYEIKLEYIYEYIDEIDYIL